MNPARADLIGFRGQHGPELAQGKRRGWDFWLAQGLQIACNLLPSAVS